MGLRWLSLVTAREKRSINYNFTSRHLRWKCVPNRERKKSGSDSCTNLVCCRPLTRAIPTAGVWCVGVWCVAHTYLLKNTPCVAAFFNFLCYTWYVVYPYAIMRLQYLCTLNNSRLFEDTAACPLDALQPRLCFTCCPPRGYTGE